MSLYKRKGVPLLDYPVINYIIKKMKFFILSLTILIGLVTLNAKELPLPRGSAPVPTKIVDRRIVDKTNCLNMVRGCGDDNHECWKNTWNTGNYTITP